MKSSNTIQVEFQQVTRQTKKLEQCADDLQKVRRQLQELMNDLRVSWAGESAELYLQKCNELSNKINTSAKNLGKTADVIERSAKAYRDAELAAIKIAEAATRAGGNLK